jgi:VWA domain-containing protein
MSCGLGAVVLVFMLVKHNVNDSSVELDNLKEDIEKLEIAKQQSIQKLKSIEEDLIKKESTEEIKRKKLETLQSALAKNLADTNKSIEEIEKIKSQIKDIKVQKKEDLIETERINEENYLLGLKVEGKKIAILIDSSASMTDEKLIDIIKTKSSSDKEKKQAKKWIRTKKIVEWLLSRLPKESEFTVVTFSEKAKSLGKQGWMKANSPASIGSVLSDLNNIIPTGATNLQIGLNTVNKYKPSDLYLITDGLPTKGESSYKSLNPFAKCSSLLGKSNTISGECRVKLFQQTITESTKPGINVDVILLPIEGDPDAINQFWYWTATSGGLVISPANNWP